MTSYLFLDTETGGLDPRQHSLLDVTLLIADGLYELTEPLKDYQFLRLDLQPTDGVYRVTAAALRKNGINLAERDTRLYTYEAAQAEIVKFLLNRRVVPVGWNLPFDLGFIHQQIMTKEQWEAHAGYRNIDLQSVARLLTAFGVINPKGNSLVHVADYFGIDTSGAHDSTFDVRMMYKVFLKLRALIGGAYGGSDPFSKPTEALPVLQS